MAAKPVRTFVGTRFLKVNVWSNPGKNGGAATFSISIEPPSYKTAEGQWQQSRSFFATDVSSIIECLQRANDWIYHARHENREAAKYAENDIMPTDTATHAAMELENPPF